MFWRRFIRLCQKKKILRLVRRLSASSCHDFDISIYITTFATIYSIVQSISYCIRESQPFLIIPSLVRMFIFITPYDSLENVTRCWIAWGFFSLCQGLMKCITFQHLKYIIGLGIFQVICSQSNVEISKNFIINVFTNYVRNRKKRKIFPQQTLLQNWCNK